MDEDTIYWAMVNAHPFLMKRTRQLMQIDPEASTEEGKELIALATLVEAYEKKAFPIDKP